MIQGSDMSQSLRLGVVGWINTRLSLFFSLFSYLFPYLHAYIMYIHDRGKQTQVWMKAKIVSICDTLNF